tara:strand:+ start:416 stop:733 length:318 start_codon:yes stop_codon:yes gene_type:complete
MKKANQTSQSFYEPICAVLDKNETARKTIYCESLYDLAQENKLDILSCNEHKAMCLETETGKFVLICYIHDKKKGYEINTKIEREYFKTWADFRKDYLDKLGDGK